ncbi:hypothetical protein [Streptomyces sp. NPDC001401]|uniref:hypothetical protein n=1 Tax=Streptomyces sp. NPDC001401 TaxID=3364570 RepID=UPI0036A5A039
MNQQLQSLQEFTVSADYGRTHTTWEVRAAGQRTPVVLMHKDSPHHSLPEYRVYAAERPDEVLGFVLSTGMAFAADRSRIGEVRTRPWDRLDHGWALVQHDLGELTGKWKGLNTRLRRAPVIENFLGHESLDALLSAKVQFSGPQSEGFDFARRAGIRAEYEVTVRTPRVDRLLILAWVVHFNEHYAVDPRKTAVDLTTNPFRDLGAARRAKKRRQTGQN